MTDDTPASTELFDRLTRFFAENDWATARMGEETILHLAFQGTSSRWVCYAQAREEARQVVFYSVAPVTILPAKRQAVAEYVTRANYGLILGNFELDLDDGELRYKTSLDVEHVELTSGLLAPVVYANVMTMDRYLPGVMAILYGDTSAVEALAQIED